MHPMRKPKPQQAQVKVDLREADTIKCEHCGNYLFIKSTVLKRLSALVSPTGEEAIIPIEIYSCGNCGQVPKDMLKGTGLEQSDVKTS
jgi:DNA-directed RNA polymerase subunit RPC12/RpoP